MDNRKDNKTFSDELKRRIYIFILDLISRNQLLRSGTSIGANYIEAIAGSSKKDFTNFLSHALKPANESKFWLALLRDTNKGNKETIANLLKELSELANILGSSVRTLKRRY